ncbi:MAG: energy-coupling factor ABC transporter ATP-binding protein [Bacillota bacterium]
MTEPLLRVEHLSWRYTSSREDVLTDISLAVRPGEAVGLTGPSGAGKSTLLQAMNGLIPHNYEGDFRGQVAIGGLDSRTTPLPRLITRVGTVFQDPETQFVGLTVEEEIAFALENQGLSDAEIDRRITDALLLVRMESLRSASPFDLSGGQKQRVAIASALAVEPDLLLLDEPTSELDPIGSEEVFAIVRELKARRNMAIIIASHATEELARFCDRVICLVAGRVVADQPAADFFARVDDLEGWGIRPPQVTELGHRLGLHPLPTTLAEGQRRLTEGLREGKLTWR